MNTDLSKNILKNKREQTRGKNTTHQTWLKSNPISTKNEHFIYYILYSMFVSIL